MKLIIGLGNPGEKYKNTRHNVGFLVLDQLANQYNENFKKKGLNSIAKLNIFNEKIILAKPQTYMNLSGSAIKELVNYYNINIKDIFIIVDDINQSIGKYKIKRNSSHGGQNGIRNIIDVLKTNEFVRLKIGIGSEKMENISEYVLSNFNFEQKNILNKSIPIFKNILQDFIKLSFDQLTNKYNGK